MKCRKLLSFVRRWRVQGRPNLQWSYTCRCSLLCDLVPWMFLVGWCTLLLILAGGPPRFDSGLENWIYSEIWDLIRTKTLIGTGFFLVVCTSMGPEPTIFTIGRFFADVEGKFSLFAARFPFALFVVEGGARFIGLDGFFDAVFGSMSKTNFKNFYLKK